MGTHDNVLKMLANGVSSANPEADVIIVAAQLDAMVITTEPFWECEKTPEELLAVATCIGTMLAELVGAGPVYTAIIDRREG